MDENKTKIKESHCPFCENGPIQVLDHDNYVYKCSNGHVWKIRNGEPLKLTKLSNTEAKTKIGLRNRQFIDEFNQLTKTDLIPPIRITDADIASLREGLLALISKGSVEVYVDQDYNINFILTGKNRSKMNG